MLKLLRNGFFYNRNHTSHSWYLFFKTDFAVLVWPKDLLSMMARWWLGMMNTRWIHGCNSPILSHLSHVYHPLNPTLHVPTSDVSASVPTSNKTRLFVRQKNISNRNWNLPDYVVVLPGETSWLISLWLRRGAVLPKINWQLCVLSYHPTTTGANPGGPVSIKIIILFFSLNPSIWYRGRKQKSHVLLES